MRVTTVFFLLFLFISFHRGHCQKKNEFGISLQLENIIKHAEEIDPGATKTVHSGWNFSFGGVYERVLSRKSGAMLGVKYRKALMDIFIPVPVGANFSDYAHFLVEENFLTIPVQYKLNFPVISISVGTSLDYFLSWEDQKKYNAPLQTYDRFFDKNLSIGLLSSISKKLAIYQNVILEPVLYYNRILSFERTYFGGSLEIRYKL